MTSHLNQIINLKSYNNSIKVPQFKYLLKPNSAVNINNLEFNLNTKFLFEIIIVLNRWDENQMRIKWESDENQMRWDEMKIKWNLTWKVQNIRFIK